MVSGLKITDFRPSESQVVKLQKTSVTEARADQMPKLKENVMEKKTRSRTVLALKIFRLRFEIAIFNFRHGKIRNRNRHCSL